MTHDRDEDRRLTELLKTLMTGETEQSERTEIVKEIRSFSTQLPLAGELHVEEKGKSLLETAAEEAFRKFRDEGKDSGMLAG